MSESSSIPGFPGLATSYWNFYKMVQIGIPVTYCLQAAPNLISSLSILTPIKTKHGFSPWKIVKLFVSPSLILFCSRAEHSDLTEQTLGWAGMSSVLGRGQISSLPLSLPFNSQSGFRMSKFLRAETTPKRAGNIINLSVLQSTWPEQLRAFCKVWSRHDFKPWSTCHIFICNCFRYNA